MSHFSHFFKSFKNKSKVFILSLLFLLFISNSSSIFYFLGDRFYNVGRFSLYYQPAAKAMYYISANTVDLYTCSMDYKSEKSCKYFYPHQWSNHQLARNYFVEGDFKNAIHYIDRELELYGEKSIQAHYVKALVLGFSNREREAIDEFSIFGNVYRDAWAPRNDKAWLQFRLGDIEGALKTINEIADKYKDNAWVQNTKGVLLLNLAERGGGYREESRVFPPSFGGGQGEVGRSDLQKAKESLYLAREAASKLTEEAWGAAYTGNDPRVYTEGLAAMKKSIEENIKLVEKKIAKGK